MKSSSTTSIAFGRWEEGSEVQCRSFLLERVNFSQRKLSKRAPKILLPRNISKFRNTLLIKPYVPVKMTKPTNLPRIVMQNVMLCPLSTKLSLSLFLFETFTKNMRTAKAVSVFPRESVTAEETSL